MLRVFLLLVSFLLIFFRVRVQPGLILQFCLHSFSFLPSFLIFPCGIQSKTWVGIIVFLLVVSFLLVFFMLFKVKPKVILQFFLYFFFLFILLVPLGLMLQFSSFYFPSLFPVFFMLSKVKPDLIIQLPSFFWSSSSSFYVIKIKTWIDISGSPFLFLFFLVFFGYSD